jgi:hypothetical protein
MPEEREDGTSTMVREAVEEKQEDSLIQMILVKLCFVNAESSFAGVGNRVATHLHIPLMVECK